MNGRFFAYRKPSFQSKRLWRWRSSRLAPGALFGLLLHIAPLLSGEDPAGFEYVPSLENIPSPAAVSDNLPLPATWPAMRHDRRLRLLLIIHNWWHAASAYQRIARRCGAALDLVVLGDIRDDISTLAHTNDQWIEAREQPSVTEVTEQAERMCKEALADASSRYDVIFCSSPRPDLLPFVEQGGIWVICGNVVPPADSPLLAHWPAKPSDKNSWHHGGSQRSDAAEVAGLPLHKLSSHQWHGIYEPAEGSLALASGEAGAAFLRRIKKGAILLVPTGPISRTWDAVERLHRAYDHDEIWLRFWDQVLHALTAGEKALPLVADLALNETEATAGKEHLLPGKIINRAPHKQKVAIASHVVSARGRVVYAGETQETILEPGESREWPVRIPVAADWPSGQYAAYLTIADPAAKKQIHQACEIFAVNSAVKITLASQKPGYRLGEKAAFAVTASAALPWQGEIRWAIHDFRGRLLGCGAIPCELGNDAKNFDFS